MKKRLERSDDPNLRAMFRTSFALKIVKSVSANYFFLIRPGAQTRAGAPFGRPFRINELHRSIISLQEDAIY
jgi:hypothetical protein